MPIQFRRLVLLPFALFVALGLWLIVTTPFPAPDELEHLSYAASLQETGRVTPLFESQTSLDRSDFTRWDTRPNYIGHPPPYYFFIAAVLDRSLPPAQAILGPRLASFTVLLLAVVLAFRAGLKWFGDSAAPLAVFVIGVALCPEIFSAARQVTNDSLAILGGALTYWSLSPAPRRQWLAGAATAMGLALALWAKPNAGLGVGALLGLLILLNYPGRGRILAAAITGGILGVLPMIPIVLKYHAIVPVTAEALFPVHSIESIAAYLPVFFFNLGYTWGYMATGIWPVQTALQVATSLAFWVTLALVAATIFAARRGLPTPAATMAAAALLAFACLTAIHLFFAATSLGRSVPAASFRYDLPLLPALIHAAAYTVRSAPTPARRTTLLATLAITMGLGWIV